MRKLLSFLQFLLALSIVIIGGILLLIYAQGYRYDVKERKLSRTGLVIIEVQPADAELTFKEVGKKGRSSYKIDGLLPGTYEVRAAKEGFHTWNDIVKVEEGLLTFRNVVLIPENLWQDLAFEHHVKGAELSPNGKVFALLAEEKPGQEVVMLGRVGEPKTEVIFTPASDSGTAPVLLVSLKWSADNELLLVDAVQSGRRALYVINAISRGVREVDLTRFSAEDDFSLNPADTNSLFVLAKSSSGAGKELARLNISTGELTKIAEDVLAYKIFGDRALYVTASTEEKSNSLFELTLTRPLPRRLSGKLPVAESYKIEFSNYNSKEVSVVLAREMEQIIIDAKDEPPIVVVSKEDSLAVSPNGKYLAFWSKERMRIYDLERKREFQIKLSGPIDSLTWFADSEHLIINTGGEIIFADIASDYQRLIGRAIERSPVWFSKDGAAVYFLSTRDTTEPTTDQKIRRTFVFAVSLEQSLR